MPFASQWKGRPVSALLITIGSVFAAAYVAMVPAPTQPDPPRLTLEMPSHAYLPGSAVRPGTPVVTRYEEGVAATGAVYDSRGLAATP